jgi:type II secretory pathway pseudopilin PulG
MHSIDSSKHLRRSSAGFSLLEFAIVLAVFAMVLGTFLVPLTKQIEQQRYAETQRILASAREALLSFAAANGRLPCPATSSNHGAEKFALGPGPGSAADGRCLTFVSGYLPAATLGFTPVDDEGFAVDAWGLKANRIHYAVASNVVTFTAPPNSRSVFTATDGIRPNPPNQVGFPMTLDQISNNNISAATPSDFLYVCASKPNPIGGSNCVPGTALAPGNAIAVIYSLGANAAEVPAANSTESVNYTSDSVTKVNQVFVSRTISTGVADPFDDVVTWIGPNLLIGRMLAAGKLP